jgi:glycosyltransferase involved in cell wall biosynthesis
MTPLVSIVVPTYHQAQYIEQTLASIVGQNWPRLELIVIDGGSTDGTREIVERYPVQHFVSERDSGQGEAINKGFRLATGDVLAWLNSDDYYLPLTLARAIEALGDASKPQLIYGNTLLWYEQEQRAVVDRGRPFNREVLKHSAYIIQPSAFWTRALWEKTGELDESMHFVLDWDWWLRASEHGELRYVDKTLSVYRIHPQHKSSSGNPRRVEEIVGFIERHGPPEWAAAYRDVAARLKSMDAARLRLGSREYRWHKLRHLDLYLKHGAKAETAFWQLNL